MCAYLTVLDTLHSREYINEHVNVLCLGYAMRLISTFKILQLGHRIILIESHYQKGLIKWCQKLVVTNVIEKWPVD